MHDEHLPLLVETSENKSVIAKKTHIMSHTEVVNVLNKINYNHLLIYGIKSLVNQIETNNELQLYIESNYIVNNNVILLGQMYSQSTFKNKFFNMLKNDFNQILSIHDIAITNDVYVKKILLMTMGTNSKITVRLAKGMYENWCLVISCKNEVLSLNPSIIDTVIKIELIDKLTTMYMTMRDIVTYSCYNEQISQCFCKSIVEKCLSKCDHNVKRSRCCCNIC